MRTDTHNFNNVRFFIYPDKQEVTFHMTFHTSNIFSFQNMRTKTLRQRYPTDKHIQHFVKGLHLTDIIPITLQILFGTGTISNYLHQSIALTDFIKASKLLTSNVPAYSPRRASSIAANVSGFGLRSRASCNNVSTKLFKLKFSRRASTRSRSTKEALKWIAVNFLSFTDSIRTNFFYYMQK